MKAEILSLEGKKVKSIDDVVDSNGSKPQFANKFLRSIKGHPMKNVVEAIEKIGSGKGNEEFLKHEKRWTVRSGESSYRIFYDRNPDGTYILTDYARQHR